MKTESKHDHQYEQDMRENRQSFVVCTVCGFAAPKTLVLRSGMVLDRQLSAALQQERKVGR